MQRQIKFAVLFLLLYASSVSAQKLPDAQQVLSQAEAQASQQSENILLIFGASWCKYCHQFEKFVESPTIRPILEKNFVIARLSVYEELGRNPQLNNPKSVTLIRKLGNLDVGSLPFMVFLNSKGEPIVNSNRPRNGGDKGGNIGYPAAPEEIDWFMAMIRKAAPAMSDSDAATLETWLRKASS